MTIERVPRKLRTFDYQRVELLAGPLLTQQEQTRDFYLAIPNDDILKGFRQRAGLPAPGEEMGGWCRHDTGVVFGQWLSGMARLSRALDDADLRHKAIDLTHEWGQTITSLRLSHYAYDKYVGGLVDMAQYAGYAEALPLLAQITSRAEAELSRERLTATDDDSQGGYFSGDMEWYTLAENLYRAYALTADPRYKAFGDVWLYPAYWEMFTGQRELDPHGVHGYSHVNTLSSAAMAYAVSGDTQYLTTMINAYDYFQETQCYATGGYGPGEKLMRPGGELGESLVTEPNHRFLRYLVGRSFETPCGTWAVFKLVSYLMQFTGAARFGDWTERMLYNGIGASPPMADRGHTFYYADYRLMGGSKIYHPDTWPCCSGTYLQDVAEYTNILYLSDDEALYVNNYVPSRVAWSANGQAVTLTQQTAYPESERVTMTLALAQPASFALRLRVPSWSQGMTALVNGQPSRLTAAPDTWAEVRRTWHDGDTLALTIPMQPRLAPIDAAHPQRVAVISGPAVLVQVQETTQAPSASPERWLAPVAEPLAFAMQAQTSSRWLPFYRVDVGVPYRMYLDIE